MNNPEIIEKIIKPNTMTTTQSIVELQGILEYIIEKNIDGDFVECGTWRGGLAAFMLYFITNYKLNKTLYIYDTFEGMTLPNNLDVSVSGESALDTFHKKSINDNSSKWCNAGIDVVNNTLSLITKNYLQFTKLVKGKVEETLVEKENIPNVISLLRLDTDWYESTKIELEIFYEKVSKDGIIILDDYNYWNGQKIATDDFLKNLPTQPYKITNGENYSLIIRK